MKIDISKYGAFGTNIPKDNNGCAYTSAKEWMTAPMSWSPVFLKRGHRELKLESCRRLAAQARDAISIAEKELSNWKSKLLTLD